MPSTARLGAKPAPQRWCGGRGVNQLGERLALDSGTLTPLLKRMEQQGLVERRRGTEDERVVHIFVTAAGRALKAKARQIPAELVCRAGCDVDDAKDIARLLALRDELHALAARLGAPPADEE